MEEWPQLVVDERIFFEACRFLNELEGDDEPFELLNSIHGFVRRDLIEDRCLVDAERKIDDPIRGAIEYYVQAVVLVTSHRGDIDDIDQVLAEFDETPTLDFIRTVAWTFLTAWTQRYGGFRGELHKSHGLVDPRIDV